MRIIPTVNTDGYITTQITPEVSSIYDMIGPDQNIPWVKKRISNSLDEEFSNCLNEVKIIAKLRLKEIETNIE